MVNSTRQLESDLKDIGYTKFFREAFSVYEPRTPKQKKAFNSIRLNQDSNYLIVGASLSGKTHLAVRFSKHLSFSKSVRFVDHKDFVTNVYRLKYDVESYDGYFEPLKRRDVVFFDNLFDLYNKDGLTDDQIKLYEILEYRNNNDLQTIFIGDTHKEDMMDINEKITNLIMLMVGNNVLDLG